MLAGKNFLNTLARNFVRSAVNQVGKDGGRVISNKVYGNRHSIPIRNTAPDQNIYNLGLPKSENTIQINDIETYTPEYFETRLWEYFFLIIGGLIIPVIGPLYFLADGLNFIFRKTTPHIRYQDNIVKKPDRRYKEGYRLVNKGIKKVYHPTPPQSTKAESIILKLRGIISLAIFTGYVLIYIWIYNIFSSSTTNRDPLPELEDTKIEKSIEKHQQ